MSGRRFRRAPNSPLKKWGTFPTCLFFPGIWHVGNVPHVFFNGPPTRGDGWRVPASRDSMGENTVSDGDKLDFDEFELPGDEMAQSADDATTGETDDGSETSAEFDNLDDLPEGPELSDVGASQAAESGSNETAAEPEPVDVSAAVSDGSDDEANAPSKPKRKLDLPTVLAFGASGLLLAALAYADLLVLGEWTFGCVVALNGLGLVAAAIPFLLWMGRGSLEASDVDSGQETRRKNPLSVYDVLLSVTLAAILVGAGLLLLELAAYKGDVFAKEKSLQSALPGAVQAAASTTAVA